MQDNSTCAHSDGSAIETHICQSLATKVHVDAGHKVSYLTGSSAGAPAQEVRDALWKDFQVQASAWVVFEGGKPCRDSSVQRTSTVHVVCDTQQAAGTLSYWREQPACQYHLVLASPVGCPLCERSDFEKVRSGCVGNEQQIKYLVKEGVTCHGGYTPPVEEVEVCGQDGDTLEKTFCKKSDQIMIQGPCLEGSRLVEWQYPDHLQCSSFSAELPAPRREPCDVVVFLGQTALFWGVTSSLCLLSLMILLVVSLWRRNRSLSSQFEALRRRERSSLVERRHILSDAGDDPLSSVPDQQPEFQLFNAEDFEGGSDEEEELNPPNNTRAPNTAPTLQEEDEFLSRALRAGRQL